MGNWFKSKLDLTDEDKSIQEVVKVLLANTDSIIEINPDDMSYILSHEEENCYISVDSVGIKIHKLSANKVIDRDIRLESGKIDAIKSLIKAEAAQRRNAKKARIFRNSIELLNDIVADLNKIENGK